MHNFIGTSTLMIALLLMTACAAPPFNHIEESARPHFESVDAYLTVPQEEIYAEIDPSNTTQAAGGGLIFAIIDTAVNHSRTNTAEELIQPIRDNLIQYDFGQVLADEIDSRLKSIDWMNARDLKLERSQDKDSFIEKFQESDASAILFITADYKLKPKFDALETTASVIMFPCIEALMAYQESGDNDDNPVEQKDNIYRNDFSKTIRLPSKKDKEKSAALLAQNDSTVVWNALVASAGIIADRLKEDLNLHEKAK